MGENVKKAMLTVLQIAAILALAMWLFRLAVCYLSKIWWVLLILAVIIAAGVFGWRWWKAHRGEY